MAAAVCLLHSHQGFQTMTQRGSCATASPGFSNIKQIEADYVEQRAYDVLRATFRQLITIGY